jgi:hypothetical protein
LALERLVAVRLLLAGELVEGGSVVVECDDFGVAVAQTALARPGDRLAAHAAVFDPRARLRSARITDGVVMALRLAVHAQAVRVAEDRVVGVAAADLDPPLTAGLLASPVGGVRLGERAQGQLVVGVEEPVERAGIRVGAVAGVRLGEPDPLRGRSPGRRGCARRWR